MGLSWWLKKTRHVTTIQNAVVTGKHLCYEMCYCPHKNCVKVEHLYVWLLSSRGCICCRDRKKDITDWEVDGIGRRHTLLKIVRDMDFLWRGLRDYLCVCVCVSQRLQLLWHLMATNTHTHTHIMWARMHYNTLPQNTWKHTMKLWSLFTAWGPVHTMLLYTLRSTHTYQANSRVLHRNSLQYITASQP